MFDFQKLHVYQRALEANKKVFLLLEGYEYVDIYWKSQFRRASISIVINIAEGTGRFTSAGQKYFYTIARGSIYECVALLEIAVDVYRMNKGDYEQFISLYEELSKMLFALMKRCVNTFPDC